MINPLIVDGQVHGGVAQGIGAALMEEVVHDDTGQILTASLVDYIVPSAGEIPAVEVHHLESELPNTKVELLYPLGEGSPIRGFLDKNPSGGIHHMCYEVDDILAARDRLKADGARVLGDGEPKIGAHGKPVLFLHPKDFCGTLVELEQA